jgi:hypothetical protein
MRIAVVMVAYGLYYTILAGNQTVASLAEEAIGPNQYATMPIIAMFAGALVVVVPASKVHKNVNRGCLTLLPVTGFLLSLDKDGFFY